MTDSMIEGNTLDSEIGAGGGKTANLDNLKELKVKVPVRILLKLHYAKITESRLMGDLVTDALTRYFQEVSGESDPAEAVGFGAASTGPTREAASANS